MKSFTQGVAATEHTHTQKHLLSTNDTHTACICESNKIFLDYYSHNAGKYTCAQFSSHTLISIKQTQEENSSIFPNNQIMLYNKYNKRLLTATVD